MERSRCRVVRRPSAWAARQWDVVGAGGEALCRCGALQAGQLVVWLGAGRLAELAAGAPAGEGQGLATALLGAEGRATALARRLAAMRQRPVLVVCAGDVERRDEALVERALLAQIKSRPEFT